MSMKPLLLAAVFTALTALPAAAEPVELVCNGSMFIYGENYQSQPVEGIHILIGDSTVQVSGNRFYSGTYSINRSSGDAALVMFDLGLWGGDVNRYSGNLGLMKWKDDDRKKVEHSVSAKCGKAYPLF